MSGWVMQRRVAAGLAIAAALTSGAALGQDVCVECKGPDRSYRCAIKDSQKAQSIRGASRAIEFVCITEIARSGGHESCRVNTTYAGPCIGQPHEIDLAKVGNETAVPAKHEPDAVETAPVPPQPAPPAVKGPPQTLEELSRETMTKSKEQFSAADHKMRKAGDAVGDSLKKTWDCMSSLFSRC